MSFVSHCPEKFGEERLSTLIEKREIMPSTHLLSGMNRLGAHLQVFEVVSVSFHVHVLDPEFCFL